ncbi:Retrovirus-related Pol polyprotein from transposon TNT 1-94-like protein [Drosera capensis]
MPRQWYKKFESVMKKYGYKKTKDDHCMFAQRFSTDDFIIQLIYVDDMLIIGKNTSRIERLKKKFVRRDVVFMKDQNIRDIEKSDISAPQVIDDLIDLDPLPHAHVPIQIEEEEQGDPGDVYVREPVDIDDVISKPKIPVADEVKSSHDNHTFDLVKLRKGRKALKNKWVFRFKHDELISKTRYKARLVVKGFTQRKMIDFEVIFSQVVKLSSVRVVLGLAASIDLEIEQIDMKTTFLHGDLQEEIYMEQL